MPTALASTGTSDVIKSLIGEGTVYDATNPNNARDHYADSPADTIVVITPGTDDGTLLPRSASMMGKRTTLVVNYPQSFWPIIAGDSGTLPFLSPTYDASKKLAEGSDVEVMSALHDADGAHPFVIYTGYSQGADALGNAAETAWSEGLLDSKSMVVLSSDPRSPWGIKAWLATMPLLPQVATAIGVESDGARDPAKTGDTQVLSVIIVGDPVSNFQWVWYRPVSSLVVDLAGFLTIHSGMGTETYGDIDELGTPTYLKSADGNTTYVIYDGQHPLALLTRLAYDELGIPYTAADLDRWEQAAEAFYPLQRPTVETAAVPVESTTAPMPGYVVTVPSDVATGESTVAPAPELVPTQTLAADDSDTGVGVEPAAQAESAGGEGSDHGAGGSTTSTTEVANPEGGTAGADQGSGDGAASGGGDATGSGGAAGGGASGSGASGGGASGADDSAGSTAGSASGGSTDGGASAGSGGDSGGSSGASSSTP